jgi:hypothetical protein
MIRNIIAAPCVDVPSLEGIGGIVPSTASRCGSEKLNLCDGGGGIASHGTLENAIARLDLFQYTPRNFKHHFQQVPRAPLKKFKFPGGQTTLLEYTPFVSSI